FGQESRQIGRHSPERECFPPYLLMNRDCRGNEVVRNGNLFVFGKEDALVGLRPHVVQVLNVILSPKIGRSASSVEMIDRIWHHHFRRKNFFVAARNLQETVPVIRLEKKLMPWVRRDCEAPFDSNVQLGHVVLRHVNSSLANEMRCAARTKMLPIL